MIKNIKDLHKPVADALDLNESDVATVLDLFWNSAREKVEGMDNIEIYIYGLGSYTAKRRKIYDLIKYYEVRKENVQNNTILKATTKEIMIADCDDKLSRLFILRDKQETKDESRRQFKQIRSEETSGSISE